MFNGKKQKSERDLIYIRNFSINLLTFYIDSSTNLFSNESMQISLYELLISSETNNFLSNYVI